MIRIAIVATLATLPTLTPAAAQTRCLPRETMVEILADTYGQARVGVGITGGGAAAVELFASAESGSWTLLLSRPDGVSCVGAAGEAWRGTPPPPPAPDGERS